MTSHQALQGEPEGSGGGPSEEVEGSPVPPPGQGTEGRTAPGHVSAEDIIGNAEVGGADAEMAAPPADAPFPPSPPWTRPPLPSTDFLAPPPFGDPKPKSPPRSRSRSPAPPPSRRSPRLQSPVPAQPAANLEELSMEVDE
jgi:hypothetical protein